MSTPKSAKPSNELDDFSEVVGEFMQYWGFKRIHGKIWAHLYLSEVPLDATTLVKRLHVSKALVSFSIHDLLEYHVIREVARGRGRTVLYEANPDVTGVILNVLRLRELKMMSTAEKAVAKLEASKNTALAEFKISRKKVADLREMIEAAQGLLDLMIGSGAQSQDLFNAFKQLVPSADSAE